MTKIGVTSSCLRQRSHNITLERTRWSRQRFGASLLRNVGFCWAELRRVAQLSRYATYRLISVDLGVDVPFSRAYGEKMENELAKIGEKPAKLSPKERARLALTLIESLDPGEDEDAEQVWLDEAERRLEAYDSGSTTPRPAEDALAEIERRLK